MPTITAQVRSTLSLKSRQTDYLFPLSPFPSEIANAFSGTSECNSRFQSVDMASTTPCQSPLPRRHPGEAFFPPVYLTAPSGLSAEVFLNWVQNKHGWAVGATVLAHAIAAIFHTSYSPISIIAKCAAARLSRVKERSNHPTLNVRSHQPIMLAQRFAGVGGAE